MLRSLAVVLSLSLSSCVIVVGDVGHHRRGSGHRAQVTRSTEAFEAIEFHGAGDLEVRVGEATRLALSADDDLLQEVRTRVQENTLIIDYPDELRFREELRVEVCLPKLKGVEVMGAAEVEISNVESACLALGLSGSGSIEATGLAESLTASISGSGELELSRLAAGHANVHISGSGDAELNVSDHLQYRISGSGDIEYIGTAHCEGVVSGSGSVRRQR